MYPVWMRKHKPLHFAKRGKFPVFIALLLLFAGILTLADVKVRPVAITLAKAELDNQVTDAVNRACAEMSESGALNYDELVELTLDGDGKVVSLSTNTAALNALRVSVGQAVSEAVSGETRHRVKLPVGAVMGVNLFSGLGPEISVEILHTGQAGVSFEHEFEEAGINQVLHRINMVASVEVLLMLPGGITTQELSCTVPLAEAVLNGTVPNNYTSIAVPGSASDSNAAEEDNP